LRDPADEMEKAHHDVFNILLQLLDDGRLTDNHGHTVDFTNTIVAMTSNIGSQLIQQVSEEGGDVEEMGEAVRESLRATFLPEFLNRIDETIIFHPLNRNEIRRVVELQVERLRQMLEKQSLALTVTEAARQAIAVQGYDPAYGARPLKRIIQQRIQNPLASELLRAEIPPGGGVAVTARTANSRSNVSRPCRRTRPRPRSQAFQPGRPPRPDLEALSGKSQAGKPDLPPLTSQAVLDRPEHGQDVLRRRVALRFVDRVEDEAATVVENLDPLAHLAVGLFRRAAGNRLLRVHGRRPKK